MIKLTNTSFYFIFFSFLCMGPIFDIGHLFFGIFIAKSLLLYAAICYFIICVTEAKISIAVAAGCYLLNRLYLFIYSLIDQDFFITLMFNGDASRLHYPVVSALSIDNILPYMLNFKDFHKVTGRMTHVFYFIGTLPIKLLDVDFNFEIFMKSCFILNTIIHLVSCLMLYKTILKQTHNKQVATTGFLALAFSPFIMAWSSMPMKETLLIFALVIIYRSIIFNQFKWLLIGSIILFFDRVYMLYITAFIIALSDRIKIFNKLMFAFFVSIIGLILFPVEEMYSQIWNLTDTLARGASEGKSLFNTGIFNNLLRTLFSPQPGAIFFSTGIIDSYFYLLHFMVQPVYIYLGYRIMRLNKKVFSLMFLILIINWILFPLASRQKITAIIPFVLMFYPILVYDKSSNNRLWRL